MKSTPTAAKVGGQEYGLPNRVDCTRKALRICSDVVQLLAPGDDLRVCEIETESVGRDLDFV